MSVGILYNTQRYILDERTTHQDHNKNLKFYTDVLFLES
jgi:hypothetical protein